MPDATITALLLGALLVVTFVAEHGDRAPRLSTTLVIALGLRVLVAALAQGHTPHDVNSYFHTTATLVSHGRDPLTGLSRFRWNFLPAMPYLWAALVHLKLPWEITVKIPAIAADCANTAFVAVLPRRRARGFRAFQYAINPVALLVASWHGQVEPVALAAALFALLALRRNRDVAAAVLIGLAITIKTWPVVFVAALLRARPRRRWRSLLATTAVIPLACFVTMPLFIHAHLSTDFSRIVEYRSYVGAWGWAGLIRSLRFHHAFGYTGAIVQREQRVALVLTVIAFVAVGWIWRRARPEVLVLALLLSLLVLTAGFGVQYLLWPTPLAFAFGTRRTRAFIIASSLYAMEAYLGRPALDTLVYLSLIVIASMIIALPFEQRFDDNRLRKRRPAAATG